MIQKKRIFFKKLTNLFETVYNHFYNIIHSNGGNATKGRHARLGLHGRRAQRERRELEGQHAQRGRHVLLEWLVLDGRTMLEQLLQLQLLEMLQNQQKHKPK